MLKTLGGITEKYWLQIVVLLYCPLYPSQYEKELMNYSGPSASLLLFGSIAIRMKSYRFSPAFSGMGPGEQCCRSPALPGPPDRHTRHTYSCCGWSGRCTMKWPDGITRIRTISGKTEEECEEKLAKLIAEMKAEAAIEREQLKEEARQAEKGRPSGKKTRWPIFRVCGQTCGQGQFGGSDNAKFVTCLAGLQTVLATFKAINVPLLGCQIRKPIQGKREIGD